MPVYGPTNTFSTQSGNVPASQIDQDFTDAFAGINNAFLVGTLGTRPAPDGVGKGRYYFATDVNGGTLYRDNGTSWVQVAAPVSSAATVVRSYLAGCGLSTAGGSGTMSIAAGVACDTTNAQMMNLAALTKTTGAWVVGSGNGGLDTGAIANATWYHFYVIERTDLSIVDVLFSLSATTPSMPAGYTFKRRIGAGLTDGANHWVAFVQDGDYFQWSVIGALDVNATNPGTAAVTATLNVPTGVNVMAVINAIANGVTSNNMGVLFSDLATTDTAPSKTATPLTSGGCTPNAVLGENGGQITVRTNTSAQIRYRATISAGSDQVLVATVGWFDRRGRDV